MTGSTDLEDLRGAEMTDAEIDAFLTEQGTGVLSLADGGHAYAVPISFGYETGRAVFSFWQFGADSRKLAFAEATETACLAVYDVESRSRWRSVLAFGELEELPTDRWTDLGELLEANAWSPDVTPIGARQLSIVGYELEIEAASGLRGSDDDSPTTWERPQRELTCDRQRSHMKVTEVIDEGFETVDDATPVSKLRSAFEDTDRKALLITSDGEFDGIVTRRDVLSSHQPSQRKAKSLVRPVPTIDRHEDLREAARLMVGGDTRILPVLEGDDLTGVVRADDLLEHVQSYLSVLSAADVASTDVVSVDPETSLGKALATFRTERIEHLPVVAAEDGENVVGIVSLYDVLEFVTRELQRSQGGDPSEDMDASTGGHHGGLGAREGESEAMLELPVRNVMVDAVGTTTADADLNDVLEGMFEFGASSAVVVDDDGALEGIVTKTDLLESLTWTDEGHLPVQVFGVDLMEELTREEIAQRIENAARKYRDMRVLEAKVHFHEHDETLRGMALVLARIRLYTDKGLFVASGEGYGDRHAFSLALNAVERQVLEGKTYGQSKKTADGEELAKIYGWWLSE
ncbi:CBS domain-containing protein [Natronobeatus ordinarius]|uniref:CBS domain-containing protein n=1 Tax=Natronobeatus ordinarius TaxID=2963433 RepID=UPI0020CD2CB4|nr:CBS domain-containing protein [Natronobeatus ordinarius]